jgi:phospholipase/lecithinase/hemolysin
MLQAPPATAGSSASGSGAATPGSSDLTAGSSNVTAGSSTNSAGGSNVAAGSSGIAAGSSGVAGGGSGCGGVSSPAVPEQTATLLAALDQLVNAPVVERLNLSYLFFALADGMPRCARHSQCEPLPRPVE